MRIWDLHCHLGGFEGRTPDERMARLLAFADRMGVERVVVFMGWPFVTDPSPDELRRQNDQVLQALSHYHDRAFGFAYVSPAHVAASLAEIDRCVRDGPMVGIKLWVARRCHLPEIDPIIRRAAALNAVIFQHTWIKAGGNLPGESTPMDLAALATRFPEVPLICGHTGGDWERGIRAVRALRNVAIDTSGSDPTAGFVEMAVRELGPRRVLYGSDIGGRSFASQLAKVLGAEVSDEAKQAILGENLRRLLAPILKDKRLRP
jgi:predicted TIM-barrel fold metal-dependent hydrolase